MIATDGFSMTAVLHRSLNSHLPTVTGGEGVYLFDHRGRRYLDASGGAAVACLGHGHERVVEAVREQIGKIAYAHSAYFTNEPAEELAAQLVALAPDGFGLGRVMYLGSGSEAMEAALKLARQYFLEIDEPSRTRFIARELAYHGNTLGALAVSGHPRRRAPYEPLLMETGRVQACYDYRLREGGESDATFGLRMADTLETEIQRLGPSTVAAFVVEPVAGATLGCVPPAPGYFQRIREICNHYGVLLIADEVMCGMGRTGSMFALEQELICPDIITIAKGLGAGYQPVAAVMANEKVVSAIRRGSGSLANGHTYMSHAVACAASLAVLKVIEEENLLEKVWRMGQVLRSALDDRYSQHPHIGDVRGRGLFQALELVADRSTKQPFAASENLAARIKNDAQEHGLIFYPSSGCVDGEQGDHILFAPPYIVEECHIEEMVEITASTLDHCLAHTAMARKWG